MSYLNTIKFQYYPNNIKIVKPLGELTLGEFLKSIKHPKPHIMQLFNDIEEASRIGDLKKKAELKSGLYYTTPAIYSDGKGRSYENIVSFNGIACVDVDGLEPEYARDFQKYLFENYQFFIATYLSPSRKGVRGLVRIPIVETVEEYKTFYYGLLSILQDYNGIDYCLKNPALPQYWTYDTEMLYRLNATIFDRKGIQLDEFQEYEGDFTVIENPSEEEINSIKLMLKRMMEKIDVEQTGHILTRSASLLAGGFVGAKYLSFDEMKDYMFELIDNTEYLQKSPRTYKQTCLQMLKVGLTSPLKYEKNER